MASWTHLGLPKQSGTFAACPMLTWRPATRGRAAVPLYLLRVAVHTRWTATAGIVQTCRWPKVNPTLTPAIRCSLAQLSHPVAILSWPPRRTLLHSGSTPQYKVVLAQAQARLISKTGLQCQPARCTTQVVCGNLPGISQVSRAGRCAVMGLCQMRVRLPTMPSCTVAAVPGPLLMCRTGRLNTLQWR